MAKNQRLIFVLTFVHLLFFQETKYNRLHTYIYSDQIVSSRKFSKHVFVQNANRDVFWCVCVLFARGSFNNYVDKKRGRGSVESPRLVTWQRICIM